MQLTEIVRRYDDELRTEDFADVDASANGLQVGPREAEIEHVAFAVDAVAQTITEAADMGADLLVTHHGLVWDGLDRVTDRAYDRLAPLLRNDLALYVSHLPLDAHPELGNAAGVADLLDLSDREPFGELGPEHIGLRGTARNSYGVEELRRVLATNLDHGGRGVQVLDFGPEEIEDVAVVTGAGADWVAEAERVGADALVTGEGKGKTYHEAREAGLGVFLAGHYATETFGVQSLRALVDDWGLKTTFLDVPTGL
jgi:dinuclear metal center YbgI/SA1388 family protein